MHSKLQWNAADIGRLIERLQLAEYDQGPLNVDPNCEQSIREIVAKYVYPYFRNLPLESRDRCKFTLANMIDQKGAYVEDILASMPDFSLDYPKDNQIFLMAFWEILFPNIKYQDYCSKDIELIYDSLAANDLASKNMRFYDGRA